MTPNTYIHSALWRWLQVAFAPPPPLWRVEGSGAELISESEALKAGALGFLRWVRASRAALAACPPSHRHAPAGTRRVVRLMAVAGRPTTPDRRPQCQSQAGAARCRSSASPRDHAFGGPVRNCPAGGSAMLASLGVRGASGRWFSASRRPTDRVNPVLHRFLAVSILLTTTASSYSCKQCSYSCRMHLLP